MTIGKILSTRYGFIGPPSITIQSALNSSGSFSPIIGTVSGDASQIYAVGVFPPTLSMIGNASIVLTALGECASPMRKRSVGKARVLGDSWADWFKNYQGT